MSNGLLNQIYSCNKQANTVYELIKPKGEMKFDGGKTFASVIFQYFPEALLEVSDICTYGAKKYERTPLGATPSWKEVNNAAQRYEDAMVRHMISSFIEERDGESHLRHKAHLAWNALATLQLAIERERNETS